MKLLDDVTGTAALSTNGEYRYALTREWARAGHGRGTVLWIMLNPSTAHGTEDDPTLRRCQRYADAWGYDGIVVANLFAHRTSHPADLSSVADPVGPANDAVIRGLLGTTALVIAAWGALGHYRSRDVEVAGLCAEAGVTLHALRLTLAGAPMHPLARGKYRIPDSQLPIPFHVEVTA